MVYLILKTKGRVISAGRELMPSERTLCDRESRFKFPKKCLGLFDLDASLVNTKTRDAIVSNKDKSD